MGSDAHFLYNLTEKDNSSQVINFPKILSPDLSKLISDDRTGIWNANTAADYVEMTTKNPTRVIGENVEGLPNNKQNLNKIQGGQTRRSTRVRKQSSMMDGYVLQPIGREKGRRIQKAKDVPKNNETSWRELDVMEEICKLNINKDESIERSRIENNDEKQTINDQVKIRPDTDDNLNQDEQDEGVPISRNLKDDSVIRERAEDIIHREMEDNPRDNHETEEKDTQLPAPMLKMDMPYLQELNKAEVEERFRENLHGRVHGALKGNRSYSGKITGMFLENDREQLTELLKDDNEFKKHVAKGEQAASLVINTHYGANCIPNYTLTKMPICSTEVAPPVANEPISTVMMTNADQSTVNEYSNKPEVQPIPLAQRDEMERTLESRKAVLKGAMGNGLDKEAVNEKETLQMQLEEVLKICSTNKIQQAEMQNQHSAERERWSCIVEEQKILIHRLMEDSKQRNNNKSEEKNVKELGARHKDSYRGVKNDVGDNKPSNSNIEEERDLEYRPQQKNHQQHTFIEDEKLTTQAQGQGLLNTTMASEERIISMIGKQTAQILNLQREQEGIRKVEEEERIQETTAREVAAATTVLIESYEVRQKEIDDFIVESRGIKYASSQTAERIEKIRHIPAKLEDRLAELKMRRLMLPNDIQKGFEADWEQVSQQAQLMTKSFKELEKNCIPVLSSEANHKTIKHVQLQKLYLDRWATPTLYEAVEQWREEVSTNRSLETDFKRFYIHKVLDSIVDSRIRMDITQTVKPTELAHVIDYLIKHHGRPAEMERQLVAEHNRTGELACPLMPSNAGGNLYKLRKHLALVNSAFAVVKYHDSSMNDGNKLQEGILTPGYLSTVNRFIPLNEIADFTYSLKNLTQRDRLAKYQEKFNRLAEQCNELHINIGSERTPQHSSVMMVGNVHDPRKDVVEQQRPPEPHGRYTQDYHYDKNNARPGQMKIKVKEYNKYLVQSFEKLKGGTDLSNFEEFGEYRVNQVPSEELRGFTEQRQKVLKTMMGLREGCGYCLQLLKESTKGDKAFILPHLFLDERLDRVIPSKSLRFCPMVIFTSLEQRLRIIENNPDYCSHCLSKMSKTSQGICYQCKRAKSMGFTQSQNRYCKDENVHVFLCKHPNGRNAVEKARTKYTYLIDQYLQTPMRGTDTSMFCFMLNQNQNHIDMIQEVVDHTISGIGFQEGLIKHGILPLTPTNRENLYKTARKNMNPLGGQTREFNNALIKTKEMVEETRLFEGSHENHMLRDILQHQTQGLNDRNIVSLCSTHNLPLQQIRLLQMPTRKELHGAANGDVLERAVGQSIFITFTIMGEDGTNHMFVYDTAASDVVTLKKLPGNSFLAYFLGDQEIEVASGAKLPTSAYLMLLPLKSGFSPGHSHMETRCLTLPNMIKEIPKVDIGDLVDEAFHEYVQQEQAHGNAPKYKRTDLPSTYGGKLSGLIGAKYIVPELIFAASNGLFFMRVPFKGSPDDPILCVGGVIPQNRLLANGCHVVKTGDVSDHQHSKTEIKNNNESLYSQASKDKQTDLHQANMVNSNINMDQKTGWNVVNNRRRSSRLQAKRMDTVAQTAGDDIFPFKDRSTHNMSGKQRKSVTWTKEILPKTSDCMAPILDEADIFALERFGPNINKMVWEIEEDVGITNEMIDYAVLKMVRDHPQRDIWILSSLEVAILETGMALESRDFVEQLSRLDIYGKTGDKTILIPVVEADHHYLVALLFNQQRCRIVSMDSFNTGRRLRCLKQVYILVDYVRPTTAPSSNIREVVPMPPQRSGLDCGFFVVQMVEEIVFRMSSFLDHLNKRTTNTLFATADVRKLRTKIGNHLRNTGLLLGMDMNPPVDIAPSEVRQASNKAETQQETYAEITKKQAQSISNLVVYENKLVLRKVKDNETEGVWERHIVLKNKTKKRKKHSKKKRKVAPKLDIIGENLQNWTPITPEDEITNNVIQDETVTSVLKGSKTEMTVESIHNWRDDISWGTDSEDETTMENIDSVLDCFKDETEEVNDPQDQADVPSHLVIKDVQTWKGQITWEDISDLEGNKDDEILSIAPNLTFSLELEDMVTQVFQEQVTLRTDPPHSGPIVEIKTEVLNSLMTGDESCLAATPESDQIVSNKCPHGLSLPSYSPIMSCQDPTPETSPSQGPEQTSLTIEGTPDETTIFDESSLDMSVTQERIITDTAKTITANQSRIATTPEPDHVALPTVPPLVFSGLLPINSMVTGGSLPERMISPMSDTPLTPVVRNTSQCAPSSPTAKLVILDQRSPRISQIPLMPVIVGPKLAVKGVSPLTSSVLADRIMTPITSDSPLTSGLSESSKQNDPIAKLLIKARAIVTEGKQVISQPPELEAWLEEPNSRQDSSDSTQYATDPHKKSQLDSTENSVSPTTGYYRKSLLDTTDSSEDSNEFNLSIPGTIKITVGNEYFTVPDSMKSLIKNGDPFPHNMKITIANTGSKTDVEKEDSFNLGYTGSINNPLKQLTKVVINDLAIQVPHGNDTDEGNDPELLSPGNLDQPVQESSSNMAVTKGQASNHPGVKYTGLEGIELKIEGNHDSFEEHMKVNGKKMLDAMSYTTSLIEHYLNKCVKPTEKQDKMCRMHLTAIAEALPRIPEPGIEEEETEHVNKDTNETEQGEYFEHFEEEEKFTLLEDQRIDFPQLRNIPDDAIEHIFDALKNEDMNMLDACSLPDVCMLLDLRLPDNMAREYVHNTAYGTSYLQLDVVLKIIQTIVSKINYQHYPFYHNSEQRNAEGKLFQKIDIVNILSIRKLQCGPIHNKKLHFKCQLSKMGGGINVDTKVTKGSFQRQLEKTGGGIKVESLDNTEDKQVLFKQQLKHEDDNLLSDSHLSRLQTSADDCRRPEYGETDTNHTVFLPKETNYSQMNTKTCSRSLDDEDEVTKVEPYTDDQAFSNESRCSSTIPNDSPNNESCYTPEIEDRLNNEHINSLRATSVVINDNDNNLNSLAPWECSLAHSLMTTNLDDKDIKEVLQTVLYPQVCPTFRCELCRKCKDCFPETQPVGIKKKKQRKNEDDILRESIRLSQGSDGLHRVTVKLPVDKDQAASLLRGSNFNSVLKEWKQKIKGLSDEMKTDINEEFYSLVQRGFIIPITQLPIKVKEEILRGPVQHYLSFAPAYKSSLSTKARCALNASRVNINGVSLNDLLPTGLTQPDLAKSFRRFRQRKYAFVADISKYFNSSFMSTESYKFNLCIWIADCDIMAPPQVYALSRLFYGFRCSSRLAHLAVELIGEYAESHCDQGCGGSVAKKEHCPGLAHRYVEVLSYLYVDDLFNSEDYYSEMENLIKYIETLMAKFQFFFKGWDIAGLPVNPDSKTLDDDHKMSLAGYHYWPHLDQFAVKASIQHNGRKFRGRIQQDKPKRVFDGKRVVTIQPPELLIEDFSQKDVTIENLSRVYEGVTPTLRLILSRVHGIFDVVGICTPLMGQVKDALRQATIMTKGKYDAVIDKGLFNFFLETMVEILKVSKYRYPRIPKVELITNKEIILITLTDASHSQIILSYMCWPTSENNWVTQLISGKSLLTDVSMSVPRAELAAFSHGSTMFATLKKELGARLKYGILCTDSMVTAWWVLKNKRNLDIFVKNRVSNITQNCDAMEELHWLKSTHNLADIGSKYRRYGQELTSRVQTMRAEVCGPETPYIKGLPWMRDIDRARTDNIIIKGRDIMDSSNINIDLTEEEYGHFQRGLTKNRNIHYNILESTPIVTGNIDSIELQQATAELPVNLSTPAQALMLRSSDSWEHIRQTPNFFMSLELDEIQLEQLVQYQSALEVTLDIPKALKCHRKSLHMTLSVGCIYPHEVTKMLCRAMEGLLDMRHVKQTQSNVKLATLDQFFGEDNEVNTLHISPEQTTVGTANLHRLKATLDRTLNDYCIKDDHPFTPHITLFRTKSRAKMVFLNMEQLTSWPGIINGSTLQPSISIKDITFRHMGTAELIARWNIEYGMFTHLPEGLTSSNLKDLALPCFGNNTFEESQQSDKGDEADAETNYLPMKSKQLKQLAHIHHEEEGGSTPSETLEQDHTYKQDSYEEDTLKLDGAMSYGLLSSGWIYKKINQGKEGTNKEILEAIQQRFNIKGENEHLRISGISYLLPLNQIITWKYSKTIKVMTLVVQAARKFKLSITDQDLKIVHCRNELLFSLVEEGIMHSWQNLTNLPQHPYINKGIPLYQQRKNWTSNTVLNGNIKITEVNLQSQKRMMLITQEKEFMEEKLGYHSHLHGKKVVMDIKYLKKLVERMIVHKLEEKDLSGDMTKSYQIMTELTTLMTTDGMNISVMAEYVLTDIATIGKKMIDSGLKTNFDNCEMQHRTQWISEWLTMNREKRKEDEERMTYLTKLIDVDFKLEKLGIPDYEKVKQLLLSSKWEIVHPAQCFKSLHYMESLLAVALILGIKISTETLYFCTKKQLQTHAQIVEGITFSKSRFSHYNENHQESEVIRILEQQNFYAHILLMETFSPLTWGIALFHHQHPRTNLPLSRPTNKHHNGRDSAILQMERGKDVMGATGIQAIIAKQCRLCKLRNKRRLPQTQGRIHLEEARPFKMFGAFKCVFLDLAGPIHINNWTKNVETRSNTNTRMQAYILIAVCSITKATVTALVPSTESSDIALGLMTISARVGCPVMWLGDHQSSFVKIAKQASWLVKESNTIKLEGLEFLFCPVGSQGHSNHASVEKKINLVRRSFGEMDMTRTPLGATEVYSLLLIIESILNNVPIGLRKAGKANQDKRMGVFQRVVSPAMLIHLGFTDRQPASFISLETDISTYFQNIHRYKEIVGGFFDSMFKFLVRDTVDDYEPTSPPPVGSVVAFRAQEGAHSKSTTPWRIGIVEKHGALGADNRIRSVFVQYYALPHDNHTDEVVETARVYVTMKRLDQLVVLVEDGEETLEDEFAAATMQTELLLNTLHKYTGNQQKPDESGKSEEVNHMTQGTGRRDNTSASKKHQDQTQQTETLGARFEDITVGQDIYEDRVNLDYAEAGPSEHNPVLGYRTDSSSGPLSPVAASMANSEEEDQYIRPTNKNLHVEDLEMTSQPIASSHQVIDEEESHATFTSIENQVPRRSERVKKTFKRCDCCTYGTTALVNLALMLMFMLTFSVNGIAGATRKQTKPTDVVHHARKGQNILLQCDIGPGEVQWEKLGGNFPANHEIIKDIKTTLHLSKVTCSYQGGYSCKHMTTGRRKMFFVFVQMKPEIELQYLYSPHMRIIDAQGKRHNTSRLEITCFIKTCSVPTSVLAKDGEDVYKSSILTREGTSVTKDGEHYQLVILGPSRGDFGTYMCGANVTDGTKIEGETRFLDLKHELKKVTFSTPMDNGLQKMERVVLNSPQAKLNLLLGGKIVETNLENNMTTVPKNKSIRVKTQEIQENTNTEDKDEERIPKLSQKSLLGDVVSSLVRNKVNRVINDTTNMLRKEEAQIKELTKETLFRKKKLLGEGWNAAKEFFGKGNKLHAEYTFIEAQDRKGIYYELELNCHGDFSGVMGLVWIKNGIHLRAQNEVKIESESMSSKLTVSRPGKSHLGNYTCLHVDTGLNVTVKVEAVTYTLLSTALSPLHNKHVFKIQAKSYLRIDSFNIRIKEDKKLTWFSYKVEAQEIRTDNNIKLYKGAILFENLKDNTVYKTRVKATSIGQPTESSKIFQFTTGQEDQVQFNNTQGLGNFQQQITLIFTTLSMINTMRLEKLAKLCILLWVALPKANSIPYQPERDLIKEWDTAMLYPNNLENQLNHVPIREKNQNLINYEDIGTESPTVIQENTNVTLSCENDQSTGDLLTQRRTKGIIYLWTKYTNVTWQRQEKELTLRNVMIRDSGLYVCTATLQAVHLFTVKKLLRVVEKPLDLKTVSYGEIDFGPITAFRCLQTDTRSAAINLATIHQCNHAEFESYKNETAVSALVLFKTPILEVEGIRCKLDLHIQHSFCGQGFASVKKYSHAHGFITTSREAFNLTENQCIQAFKTEKLKIKLGYQEIELTAKIGKSTIDAFIHGTTINLDNTCTGATWGQPIYISHKHPNCTLGICSGRIVHVTFQLEIDKEQGVVDLESQKITFPRLGITSQAKAKFRHTSQQGIIICDLSDIMPNSDCNRHKILYQQIGKLYEAGRGLDNKDDIPRILTLELDLPETAGSKLVAFQLLDQQEVCDRGCYSTQVKNLYLCLTNEKEPLNGMGLTKGEDHNVLKQISSFGLNHIQLSLAKSISGILYDICQQRRRQIRYALSDFNKHGGNLIDPEDRNYKVLSRGEIGFILQCTKTIVIPRQGSSNFCCANLPVTVLNEKEQGPQYITPVSHVLVPNCDPATCTDTLPITYYTDKGIAVCQSKSGLRRCDQGKILNPNEDLKDNTFIPLDRKSSFLSQQERMTNDHLQIMMAEQQGSNNFASSVLNALQANVIACEDQEFCSDTSNLDYVIQREIARQNSSWTDFTLEYTLFGRMCQGFMALFFSWVLFNCCVNFMAKMKTSCCNIRNRSLSCWGVIWIFWDSLDASFNPWSMTRQEWLRRIEFLEQSVAELSARVQGMKIIMGTQQEGIKKINQINEEVATHLQGLAADQRKLTEMIERTCLAFRQANTSPRESAHE